MKKMGLTALLTILILVSIQPVLAFAGNVEGKTEQGVVEIKKPKTKKGELVIAVLKKEKNKYSFPIRNDTNLPNPFGNGDVEILFYIYDGKKYRMTGYDTATLKSNEVVRAKQMTILSPGKSAYGVNGILTKEMKGWEKWSTTTKVKKVHHYVSQTFSYDYARKGNQGTWYIPDYNRFMKNKKGTCYDIASLTSSLLREMEVPTRLTMGYPKRNVYHAWNEVYINNEWKVIDVTYDLQEKVSTPYKKTSDYKVKYRF